MRMEAVRCKHCRNVSWASHRHMLNPLWCRCRSCVYVWARTANIVRMIVIYYAQSVVMMIIKIASHKLHYILHLVDMVIAHICAVLKLTPFHSWNTVWEDGISKKKNKKNNAQTDRCDWKRRRRREMKKKMKSVSDCCVSLFHRAIISRARAHGPSQHTSSPYKIEMHCAHIWYFVVLGWPI